MLGQLRQALLIFLCLQPSSVWAQDTAPASTQKDWDITAQVLTRGEVDQRDFDLNTSPLFWTVMRTRVGLSKSLFEHQLDFLIQIQDSRTFGDVGASIGNLNNLDLYQGYLQANGLLAQDLSLQIGRFELDYGNGRLFNPLPGWNYIGQSYDGGRLKYRLPGWNQLHADLFAVVIKNATAAIRNPTPTAYTFSNNLGHAIYGSWLSAEWSPQAKLDAFGYYEWEQQQQRFTLGVNHRGQYAEGLFSSSLELNGQHHSSLGMSALWSASAFVHPGDYHMGVGFDSVGSHFSQAYGNNHAFYGYMDYFLNIPVNTKNLGLNDVYLKASWSSQEWPIEASLDLHHFMAQSRPENGEMVFGQEVDFTLSYKQGKNKYIWGMSAFLPGNLFQSDLFFGRSQPAFWSYLQAIVNF